MGIANTNQLRVMTMKARSYLRNVSLNEIRNDWFTVKAGAGAFIAQTTPVDEMHIAGEIHDLTVMDPADLLSMFEDYEDPNCEDDEWGIL